MTRLELRNVGYDLQAAASYIRKKETAIVRT